jgi:bacteriocin-like protein
MSQNYQDQSLNQKQPSQETSSKDNESRCKDEAAMENGAIAEELSTEELTHVSGGVNEERSDLSNQDFAHYPLSRETDPFEPGTTFPVPPRPEDSP